MLNVTIDSFVVSYLNLPFFHPRRKGTGSVEQFFSQMTMMCGGGMKLDCREITDILSRVMITNALRLCPISKTGFSFLGKLESHMTSYKDQLESDFTSSRSLRSYSDLKKDVGGRIIVQDSLFDEKQYKERKIHKYLKEQAQFKGCNKGQLMNGGNVRKYFKKF